jgi:hypothetical protein
LEELCVSRLVNLPAAIFQIRYFVILVYLILAVSLLLKKFFPIPHCENHACHSVSPT